MSRQTKSSIVKDPEAIKLKLLRIATKKTIDKNDAVRVTALKAILATLSERTDDTDAGFIEDLKRELAGVRKTTP